MRKACFIISLVGILAVASGDQSSTLSSTVEEGQPLTQTVRFRSDGTYTIVVFTDLHYGEGDDLDLKNNRLQQTILDAEQPDLIVYLGDIVSGWRGGSQKGWMEQKMRTMLEYPNKKGYLHAMLLGNHDDEADLSRAEILEADVRISGDLSLTQVGPLQITGASNYYIDVLNSSPRNPAVVDARLWFFDSMNRGCENDPTSWGCVGRDTVSWMRNLTANSRIPPALQSLAFVHIPLPEHRFAYGDFRTTGIRQEDSACPVVNTGLAEQLIYSNISMVISGHDHQNDFVGNIHFQGQRMSGSDTAIPEGNSTTSSSRFLPGSGYSRNGDVPMLMAYGRKSGYGSYGPGEVARGARVIRLKTIQTPFDDLNLQYKETRFGYPSYTYSQFWALPPQEMHSSPFSQMQTWVSNEFGIRETERRPSFKYEVQPQCYNAAWLRNRSHWIASIFLICILI